MKAIAGSLLCFVLFPLMGVCQDKGWQHMDLQADHQFGISTGKAYELLKGKKHRKVLVAVIDSGIDTAHTDLRGVLSSKGWGFLGNANGENVHYENLELVRMLRPLKKKFEDPANNDTTGFTQYQALKREYVAEYQKAEEPVRNYSGFKRVLDTMTLAMGNQHPSLEDFKLYQPATVPQTNVKRTMLRVLAENSYDDFYNNQVVGPLQHYQGELDYHLNFNYEPRKVVGDNPDEVDNFKYGNKDVMGPDASHGTHVAGIIGAVRGNGIGLDGVADDVAIMSIRTVPDGDERDKDVAAAVRYAVKHGAKVINMSFGKGYTTNQAAVDNAMAYAAKHDVLLVQAAGNEGKNIDSANNYPRRYRDVQNNWIVVGASGPKDDKTLAASFSNYGAQSVDVFAPGVSIYSSVPGSKYDTYNGTSMAAPVVAGLAALIREYYPRLSAAEVKAIILQSVITRPVLAGKCVTSGVVNAYEAMKLAAVR